MSRGDGEGEENFPNEWAFWDHRVNQVLKGKKGRKALAELREALMALPEHRLIANALTTHGLIERAQEANEARIAALKGSAAWVVEEAKQKVADEGLGVCAVGAYAWHKMVREGATPEEAFARLPNIPDYDGGGLYETAQFGTKFGMTFTLAMTLAAVNDDDFAGLTPESRWQRYMQWIDEQLARAEHDGAIA